MRTLMGTPQITVAAEARDLGGCYSRENPGPILGPRHDRAGAELGGLQSLQPMELDAEVQACRKSRRSGELEGIPLLVVSRSIGSNPLPLVVKRRKLQCATANQRDAGAMGNGHDRSNWANFRKFR